MQETTSLGLLSLENISYHCDKELLLDGINFVLHEGEIHTLLYSNPQECSLLSRILKGEISGKEYFGNIYWNSRPILFSSPRVPLSLGLALADSNPSMIREFSIQENIFLGIEEDGDFFLDKEREEKETWNWLKLFRLPFSPQTLLGDLDPDIYYLFCVLRALRQARKLLVLHQELVEELRPKTQEILRQYLVKQVRQGLSVLYVCINPQYLFSQSHRTSQLEKGSITLKWLKNKTIAEQTLDGYFQPNWVLPHIQRSEEYEDALVSFLGWEGERKSGAKSQKVDFHCYSGKMQGLGGLAPHNRTALRNTFSGFVTPIKKTTLLWRGQPLQFRQPVQALENRVAVVSREYQLIKEFTLKDNLLLKVENSRVRILLDEGYYLDKFNSIFERYHIDMPPLNSYIEQLSPLQKQLLLLTQSLALEPLFIYLEDPTWQLEPREKEQYFEILNLVCKNNISLLVLCSTSWDFAYLPCRKLWLEEGSSIEDLLRGKEVKRVET